ncbi:MAG TPA: alkaline phosphatase [Woeseiaceae bacterium]|nr:alkaline phosphatase [Woeseiaceae bacterium]
MKKSFVLLIAVTVTAIAGCAPFAPQASQEADEAFPAATPPEVRNIILMIADGVGAGAWTAAEFANNDLAVKRMPVVGLIDTRSAVHKVSDSAAGATVYATGQRVVNRTLSVGPASACPLPAPGSAGTWPEGCEPLETWFEAARDKGRATGIVTTTFVTDATPAAFVGHSPSRYWREELAVQVADFGLDVLFGGGARDFDASTRADGRDLLGEMCRRSRCLASPGELDDYRPDNDAVAGLFASGDMDELEVRPVTLPSMVSAALKKLAQSPDGFVAMFETEATDNATHANAPLERVTNDLLEFDRAVAVALDFASRTPGTLVVVTADHETGGFSLVESGNDFELTYANRGHTAAMVPIFAFGPQAERFGGLSENFQIGQLFRSIVDDW